MEDLITDPPLSTADHPECNTGCFAQVEATGTKIADEVAARLGNAIAVPIGFVGGRRTAFCVPLENNCSGRSPRQGSSASARHTRALRRAAANAGRAGQDVKTSVAVMDVGPTSSSSPIPARPSRR